VSDSKKTIAIYGGNFDPPQNGHLMTISHLLNYSQIDEVWLVPAGDNRYDRPPIASGAMRLKMMQLVHKNEFNSSSRLKVLDLQMQENLSQSRTVDLLDYLQANFFDHNFYYVIGADNITSLTNWQEFERLIRLTKFLAVPRRGQLVPESLPTYVELLGSGNPESSEGLQSTDVSSTIIRKMIASGDALAGYLPQYILDFIIANRLYKGL
jgi:nicotinate-nucleotide adenylyltransferase